MIKTIIFAIILFEIFSPILSESRNKFELQPSYSYLTFDTNFENSTNQFTIFNNSLYILARPCIFYITSLKDARSNEFNWIQRDLYNSSHITYQVFFSAHSQKCVRSATIILVRL